MLRHIVIKLTKIKDKEKILNATRGKQHITYKVTPIRLSADFSAETDSADFSADFSAGQKGVARHI